MLKMSSKEEAAKSVLRFIQGVAIGFKKSMKPMEEYFRRQMGIKYTTRTYYSMIYITGMIVIQEVLLWIQIDPNIEAMALRYLMIVWVIAMMVLLVVGVKWNAVECTVMLGLKTSIYLFDLVALNANFDAFSERSSAAYFIFMLQCKLDPLVYIVSGIYPFMEGAVVEGTYFVVFLIPTLIYRYSDLSTISVVTMMAYFTVFDLIDLSNHYNTELSLFFTHIRIEQKGYYLTTFVDRLLPKHIKGIGTAGTEKYSGVTLLFADIVGFTEYSAGKNPRQIVDMLSQLFTAFDKECNKLNLYKLYTIGDCYVVMSFLDKNNRKKPKEEANDVIQLGIFLIKAIQEVRKKINFDKLNMRIGVHTGTVYGGVIGSHIVRFDLYGPDVLTANKMESNGAPGRVNVSETTKELLDDLDKHNYSFEFNKDIEIKALNKTIKSYFLDLGDAESQQS